MRTFVLAFMLVAVAHANYIVQLNTYLLQIMPLVALALGASLFLTALMYMLGNFLQSPDILTIAKDNLSSVIFSALIVLMFIGLFQILATLSTSIACGYPCDHLQAAHAAVTLLRTRLVSLYTELYLYELLFGFLSTLGFSIPLPAINPATMLGMLINIPSLSFSPLSGLMPLSNAHTVVVEAVGSALLMVLARQVLLEFIMKYLFPFFLLGVGLRSFIFTRRTGSSILALVAVMYFVYPLAVLGTNYLIFDAYKPVSFSAVPTAIGYCENPQDITTLAEKFKNEREEMYKADIPKNEIKWYKFWTFFTDAAHFIFNSFNMIVNTLFAFNLNLMNFLIFPSLIFSTFYDFLIMEIQTNVQFLVLVFVSFVLELVITITMYRSVASFMEGETEIFGLSKLV